MYLYDGANLIGETDATGNWVARYAFGGGIDQPLVASRGSSTAFYQADGLGSITSLSTTGGTLSDTLVYDSFGNVTSSTGSFVQPFRFTARESDPETNLSFYRARYYGSTTGRFLSEDPIRYAPKTLNFYAYVDNTPTNSSDPLGLCPNPDVEDCLKFAYNQALSKSYKLDVATDKEILSTLGVFFVSDASLHGAEHVATKLGAVVLEKAIPLIALADAAATTYELYLVTRAKQQEQALIDLQLQQAVQRCKANGTYTRF